MLSSHDDISRPKLQVLGEGLKASLGVAYPQLKGREFHL